MKLEESVEKGPLGGIYRRVVSGKRLTREDGLRLYGSQDLHALGFMANVCRQRLHGFRTTYVLNQHLNYTNICGNRCAFCAFYRDPCEGYVLSAEEVRRKLQYRLDVPIREIHVVGGVNPDLPYRYYLEILDAIREARPEAMVKAFTMVELDQIWRTSGKAFEEVLTDLKDHGVALFPGGGAEVFSERLHREDFPDKPDGEAWLTLARRCHEFGLPSNATMLYGHRETLAERVDHLLRLRQLQDETEGFLAFVALPFQSQGNRLSGWHGPGGAESLKTIAISRLLLDNIPHIKAYWVMLGVKLAQVALQYGADDLDGTIREEQISHAAGARSPQQLEPEDLIRLIREAGQEPVERDALYSPVLSRFS